MRCGGGVQCVQKDLWPSSSVPLSESWHRPVPVCFNDKLFYFRRLCRLNRAIVHSDDEAVLSTT